MKRTVAVVVMVSFVSPSLALAVDSKKAAYFGGTVSAYAGAKNPVEGALDLTSADKLVLRPGKDSHADLEILYNRIEDLEYGQKAGRRVGTAVATTALLGPIGLVSLFSKKRKHYLTISYKDETGMNQVAILELGKDIVRETLPIVRTRSGKEIVYQDEEASKSSR